MKREGNPKGILGEHAFKNKWPFMKRQFIQISKALRSIKRTEKENYGIVLYQMKDYCHKVVYDYPT